MNPSASQLLEALLEIFRAELRGACADVLTAELRANEASHTARLLDKCQLAEALSVSVTTVNRLCRSGRIPFEVVGDTRRFDLQAVRAALRTSSPEPRQGRRRESQTSMKGIRLLSRGGNAK